MIDHIVETVRKEKQDNKLQKMFEAVTNKRENSL